MVFGTYRNPKAREVPQRAGFVDGASSRIGAMLAFRDVSGAPAPAAPRPTLRPGYDVR